VVALKFKPKKELKDYQTQEKLVSIDERVEEAMNFRKELNNLEVSEANRIRKLREQNVENQLKKLRQDQRKEREQVERKIQVQENNLIIRMKRDFDILRK